MPLGFAAPLNLPPAFDNERATRTLAEMEALAPDLAGEAGFRSVLEFAAGNSPYLARLMLKERAFLPELLQRGPALCLAALNAEALATGEDSDTESVMRRLRAAKRRAALAIGLADIAGVFDLGAVTGALTRFAESCVRGALRFLLAGTARQHGQADTAPR